MYALNLGTKNEVLSVTEDKYAPSWQPLVDSIPENAVLYDYIDGQIVLNAERFAAATAAAEEVANATPEPTVEQRLENVEGTATGLVKTTDEILGIIATTLGVTIDE